MNNYAEMLIADIEKRVKWDDTYNGWTNKATWLVNLWLGEMQHGREVIADVLRSAKNKLEAEELLHDAVADIIGSVSDGFAADLISYALNEVNWKELVDLYSEEII